MTPQDFSKALLRSAKALDVPAAGAKTRALGQLATSLAGAAVGAGGAVAAVGAGAVASGAAGSAARLKLGIAAWAIGGAAVAAAGGFALARTTATAPEVPAAAPPPAPAPAPMPAAPAPEPRTGRSAALAGAAPLDDAAAAPVDMCIMHTITDAPAATCSRRGKPVSISLRLGCTGDVDVFWVDYNCQEVFHHRLTSAADSFARVTQDGHVWRVRDHATHALLKELTPQRLPGVVDRVPNAPPRVLPEVVLHPTDRATSEDVAPAVCSGTGMPSTFTVKNERDDQVVVMWVGLDCKEKYWERVESRHSMVVKGRDGDAWRIRDAKTGGLLFDVVPDALDTTTYLTVP